MTRNLRSKSPVAPHLALIAVQVLFATWPIVGKIALRTIPAVALVGFRLAGAALTLLILVKLSGTFQKIERGDWLLLIISSMLGVVLNQFLFTKGLSLTTAINATLLSTAIPVFTLLVGVILGTDRATLRRVLGIALAAAGVIYLIGPGRTQFSSSTRIGDLLIVANSLCYGAYIAVSKDLMKRYNALSVITWIFVVSCVVAAPAGAVSLAHLPLSSISWRVWLAILYIIVLPTAGAYYLNGWALARVPPRHRCGLCLLTATDCLRSGADGSGRISKLPRSSRITTNFCRSVSGHPAALSKTGHRPGREAERTIHETTRMRLEVGVPGAAHFLSRCSHARQIVRRRAFRVAHDSQRTYMARAKKCMMA